ncbi:MAG: RNA polymerase sigma factor [Sphingopyxis sp.]|uniref:RNA polymerase sigma factor n=1 Tax=Sphingopyxis sp. TaxID=1908224 RepID=UPI002ABA4BC2|nr:RNA polymerase sigma factor [Sphingopyxis sp.]MDZ3831879.1 RNA polymerase sigma factor [Sphingopyxis sp.]
MQPAKDRLDLGRRWRPALLSYFLRRVRDHAEAEDLTQELIAKLLKHESPDFVAPEAYIFQMASNLLADRARRIKVRAQYRDMVGRTEDAGVDPLDPFRVAAGRAELSSLAKAVAALPERTRAIFILYRLENLGQDKIAETFGISVSAVKKHVARAMAGVMREMRNPQ